MQTLACCFDDGSARIRHWQVPGLIIFWHYNSENTMIVVQRNIALYIVIVATFVSYTCMTYVGRPMFYYEVWFCDVCDGKQN